MPAKEENPKASSTLDTIKKEKRTDLSLIILSSLLLITLGSVVYLYFNLRSTQKKADFFGQKPFTTTDVTLKGQTNQNSQARKKNELINFRDVQSGIALSYPSSWGSVSSQDVAGRKTFTLGESSNFSVIVGPHLNPDNNQPMTVEDLLAEGVIQSGCQRSEKTVSNQKAVLVACERTANSSQQAYLEVGQTIYILFYRYDAIKTKPAEAAKTFNLVLDSFTLL